jgi:hypothetical protein
MTRLNAIAPKLGKKYLRVNQILGATHGDDIDLIFL